MVEGDTGHTKLTRDLLTDTVGQKQKCRHEEDEKQHNFEYHTPVDNGEVKQLSQEELVTNHTEETGERRLVSSDGNKVQVTGDDTTFQPQDFSSPAPLSQRFDEMEGEVVRPKPHPLRPGLTTVITADSVRRRTDAFASPEPLIPTTSKHTGTLEEVSVVSSTASSFHDTSHHLQNDYSSLSLDRHSDVEESMVHMGGGEERGRDGLDAPQRSGNHAGGLHWRVDQMLKQDGSYLIPVSNSPVDIVTMLTRLACFTNTLLNTLTPKLRHGAVPGLDEPRVS